MSDKTTKGRACVQRSPIAGYGLFATESIGAGELVTGIKRPSIAALDSKRLVDTCDNCFVWTGGNGVGTSEDGQTVKACMRCRVVRYCGKECQTEAWKRSHKFECAVLRNLFSERKIPPGAVRAAMQIIYYLENRKDGWQDLLKLESHLEKVKAQDQSRWEMISLMSIGAFNFTGGPHPNRKVSAELALEIFGKVAINCVSLVTPTFDPLGTWLDPFVSRANHSCDPNAFMTLDGPKISLRSLKHIEKGEEILISYIDVSDPYSRRQAELRERYCFTCQCSYCRYGSTMQQDIFLPMEQASGRPSPEELSAIQDRAYEMYDLAEPMEDTQASIDYLKKAIRLCLDTKIWPLHRQPLPQLLRCLVVNFISSGQYLDAWRIAVELYFDVDPKNFPVPHHPVRVVRNWTLALLSLCLANERDNPAIQAYEEKGLDWGVVIYGLLIEVRSNVSKSHGLESSFAKRVVAKVEEVTVDMTRGGSDVLRGALVKMEEQWGLLKSFKDGIRGI